jgi:hypothetical protein
VRNRVGAVFASGKRAIDLDEALRIRHARQRPDEERVHAAEDGSVQSNARGERQNDYGREPGSASDLSERVPDVLRQRIAPEAAIPFDVPFVGPSPLAASRLATSTRPPHLPAPFTNRRPEQVHELSRNHERPRPSTGLGQPRAHGALDLRAIIATKARRQEERGQEAVYTHHRAAASGSTDLARACRTSAWSRSASA